MKADGAALDCELTDFFATDLSLLTVVAQADALGGAAEIEAPGRDLGTDPAGWASGSAIGLLVLGYEETGQIRLVNNRHNVPGPPVVEAVYVHELEIYPGAQIDLNGIHLYYANGGAPKQLFLGDSNLDGVVNVQDLSILATNWSGSSVGWYQGDSNGDGVVNVQDLSILATNWGSGAGGAVPEPGALALLAMGGVLLARRRRRTSRR